MSQQEPTITVPMCAIFRRFLKRKGLKFTRERAVILQGALQQEGVFEADSLYVELQDSGESVSKATLYRTLKHLLEAGILQEVLLDSSRVHYQQAFGRPPTGHLMCVETKQVIEFPIDELNTLVQKVCKEHGYEALSHRFVIYGTSPVARKGDQAEEDL